MAVALKDRRGLVGEREALNAHATVIPNRSGSI